MDIRTQRTKNNIINSFIELRSKKPIEKITVKELADLACINKATFYRHYEDIFALSEEIENELLAECIASIPADKDLLSEDGFYCLTEAFVSQSKVFDIIFSGSRMNEGIHKLHEYVMERIYKAYPEIENNLEKRIILSSAIYGDIYMYYQYKHIDFDFLINCLAKNTQALNNLLFGT